MKTNKNKEQEVIKDERVQELCSDYMYISIKKFCELKGISRATFWRISKKDKNLSFKTIKRKKYIKVKVKEVKSKDMIFIDENNIVNIVSLD